MRTLNFPFSINEVRKYLHGNTLPSPGAGNEVTWNGSKREQSDHTGLCFQCWSVKQYFFMPCERCGRGPTSVDEVIYSIALSGQYYDPPTLRRLSELLMSGQKTVTLTLEQMDALRPAAFRILEQLSKAIQDTRKMPQ